MVVGGKKHLLANYMNNFIILVKTKKKFKKRTIWFLKIAKKYNLCFKQSKYNFNTEKISILEVAVEWEEVQMENNKVNTVKK